jgi:hypothetical protein
MERIIALDTDHLVLMVPACLARVEVKAARIQGLECYRVLVNGTELSRFLSREQANTKARAFAERLAAA